MAYEEDCNEYSARHYWVPLLKKLLASLDHPPTALAVGCGVAAEVDVVSDSGIGCLGIDCGNRTDYWGRRRHRERLFMANGMFLPFEDNTFDAVFCGCVFAHVGVLGDSFVLSQSFKEDRQKLANEMVRVTKPGGNIIVASPNRYFPLDIFHGRDAGSYRVRFNRPGDRFLLSHGDLHEMFVDTAGCRSSQLLPVDGFWGFIRANRSLKGRLLSTPIKLIFKLLARPGFSFLRGTIIDPWITTKIVK